MATGAEVRLSSKNNVSEHARTCTFHTKHNLLSTVEKQAWLYWLRNVARTPQAKARSQLYLNAVFPKHYFGGQVQPRRIVICKECYFAGNHRLGYSCEAALGPHFAAKHPGVATRGVVVQVEVVGGQRRFVSPV